MSDFCGGCRKHSYQRRWGPMDDSFGYCTDDSCYRSWQKKKEQHAFRKWQCAQMGNPMPGYAPTPTPPRMPPPGPMPGYGRTPTPPKMPPPFSLQLNAQAQQQPAKQDDEDSSSSTSESSSYVTVVHKETQTEPVQFMDEQMTKVVKDFLSYQSHAARAAPEVTLEDQCLNISGTESTPPPRPFPSQ